MQKGNYILNIFTLILLLKNLSDVDEIKLIFFGVSIFKTFFL